MWYKFCQFWCQMAFVVAFRLRVDGRENVPPAGPVLLVSNHQSFLDPVLIGVGLARPVHYLARSSLFESSKIFSAIIRSLNAVPIRREAFSKESVRECIDILSRGNALALFPEGTRTRDGHIGRLRAGFGMIAARSGSTVVPALIQGAFEAWPRSRPLPCARPIRVRFGRAIGPEEVQRLGRSITERVQRELAVLESKAKGL